MFERLKIGTKILFVNVGIVITVILAISIVSHITVRQAFEREAFNKLTAVREMKAQQIEDYFRLISRQIIALSQAQGTIDAMNRFETATRILELDRSLKGKINNNRLMAYYSKDFSTYYEKRAGKVFDYDNFVPKDNVAKYLQDIYIFNNPNKIGEKLLLLRGVDDGEYGFQHSHYHPFFADYLAKFGYYDIFLISPESGRIVYSVFKEVDFATSLLKGPHRETNLARAFKAALKAKDGDSVSIVDFEPYLPSYDAPAAFIASPIFDGSKLVGVLAFQMPVDRINNIMTSHQGWKSVGLGVSGETYLVGADKLLRNQSRFLIEDSRNYFRMIREIGLDEDVVAKIDALNTTIGLQIVDTIGTRDALAGNTGANIFADYRGVNVLSAYRPLKLSGLNWAIMSEIDESEAFAAFDALRNRLIIAASAITAIIIFVSYYFSLSLTRPLRILGGAAERLTQGKLDEPVQRIGRDEIGDLAQNFEKMRQTLRELIEGLETKVAERTAELRAIMNSTQDAIVCVDDSGQVILWNPAAENMFGRSDEDMLGSPLTAVIPERHRGAHEAGIRRLSMNEESRAVGKTVELSGLRKDGSEFPIELSIGTWTVGKRCYFSGVIRDITDRKRDEKALADHLALVEALVDTLPNPIFVKDTETRYTILNKAFLDAFGYAREDLIGKTVMDLERNPIELRRKLQQEAEGLIRTGGMVHKESSRRYADGKVHDLLYWETAFELSDGVIGGLVGVHVDITHQKELERELAIANKRMGDELNIGREIQMSMIPLTFPRFPEHKDIDVWAYLRPAREVGGDFYDFFMIDERLFGFVVADVSGKGVPAALLMAVAKTLLKANAQDTKSTARIIERTNNELSHNNQDCMFITAFFGIIDTKTGVMTYTNAGHNPPFLMLPDGPVKPLNEVHGPMIGVMEGMAYEQAEVRLGVDDKLVLYTDGITEAFNADGRAFGDDRLPKLLGRSGNLGTKYLVDAIVREVDEFSGDAEQSDDITVFCLRYVAWEEREDSARIELHLTNEIAEIDRALMALNEFSDHYDLPQDVRNDVGVVLDDLLNNVITYAFEDQEDHLIEVTLAADKQRLIVTVSDDGVEFDPFLRSEPDIESDIEDRQVGGLGIHLVRNLMDDLSYRRIDGRNVTTLMKRMGE